MDWRPLDGRNRQETGRKGKELKGERYTLYECRKRVTNILTNKMTDESVVLLFLLFLSSSFM